jgi:hypothetical protein
MGRCFARQCYSHHGHRRAEDSKPGNRRLLLATPLLSPLHLAPGPYPSENFEGFDPPRKKKHREPAGIAPFFRGICFFVSAARDFTCNHGDVDEFTEAVPGWWWWKTNGGEVGAWAIGAQITFSFSPNSAAAERIFSQMKDMFGAKQAAALAGILQAAMMLRYHKRLA